jgi:hypothetical protein
MEKQTKKEEVDMICICGHNKLYHEPDCIGMMCNCKKFKQKGGRKN